MKKLFFAVIVASLISTSAMAAAVWSSSQNIKQVGEHPFAGSFIVAENTSTLNIVKCYIRGTTDQEKKMLAIGLSAKASTSTVTLYLDFTADPTGAVAGSPCILTGIQVY